MSSRSLFLITLFVDLSFISSASARYTREVEETFRVSDGGQLTVVTIGSDVTVVTGSGDTVDVLAKQNF